MPDRRRGPAGQRPQRRITYVQALEKYVSHVTGERIGRRWVRHWLIENPSNRNTVVPMDAPCTITTALRLLFEWPYTVIAQAVEPKLEVVVEIRDQEASRVFVILGSVIVHRVAHGPGSFRFPTKTALEKFMAHEAGVIRRAVFVPDPKKED